MPLSCSVLGCKSKMRKNSGISFHSFPKQEKVRQRWLRASSYGVLNWDHRPRVCSKHFKKEDFVFGGNIVKLSKFAVPSVCLASAVTKENDPLTSEEILSVKEKSELYCRLCLCVSTDSNKYIHIFPSHGGTSVRQDKIQKMIQKIIPDLDLSLTQNPGICAGCEGRLDAAFEFISFSIQNQEILIDYKFNNVPINIQDVVKTFDDRSNECLVTAESEVPSKKQKPNVPCHDQRETKEVIQQEDITIKEEFNVDYFYDILDSTEGSSIQAVIEQSGNILDNQSTEEDKYYLKHMQGCISNLKQISTNDSEKQGVNKSGKALECAKNFDKFRSPIISLGKIRVKDTKMKVKQSYKLDSSKS